jgi:hypothetical protein
MQVVETLLLVRLVMRHKKMNFVQLVEVLFGTSALLSDVVTDCFYVLRVSPTVEIIILNLGIGPLRRAFLTWISEFLTGHLSMSVSHLRPKLALNPETSKKE